MRRLFPLLVLWSLGLSSLVPLARAAAYAPAATASIDWTPNTSGGVGVPGGIPARTTIYTTITTTGDSTDRVGDITTALNDCPEGQTVLLGAGTFYVSGIAFTQNGGGGYYKIGNRTLRGSGSDAATGTVLRLTGSGGISVIGSELYNTSYGGSVTGTPTKGDTTLSITDSGEITVGRLMQLATEDDDTLPVINVNGYGYNKTQIVLITAVNTGAGTVTFQPALYQTPTKRTGGSLAMTWAMHADGNIKTTGIGFEDMLIDNTHGSAQKVLRFVGAHGNWVKNVRLKGVLNYGLEVAESAQCEFRRMWIEASRDPSWVTSNHAGIGLVSISACLFEDNIIEPNFPLIEAQNGAISGNVFGYNFAIQGANVVGLNASHSVGNHCNLWEGNSATNFSTDGYFGSAADDVLYRNDWHGVVLNSAIPDWPIFLGRFARRIEAVGNQLGRTGTTLNITVGPKTRFNQNTSGTANNYDSDPHVDTLLTGTLTTRTSDSEGVITMDTTLGTMGLGSPWVDDISLVAVRWGTSASYSLRNNMTRGSVNTGALTVAVSGGVGSNLPSVSTAVRIYTAPNGYVEQDDAVEESLVRLGNYQYSSSSIDVALGSTTLPDSLYRSSAPSFMSGYNWPPYSPTSPDPRYEAIPAGARYVASTGPGTPTHTSRRALQRRR